MRKVHPVSGASALLRRMLPCGMACAATLLSLPLQAVTVPTVPLQSGAAYPPANVMFILDDSGSMEYVAMPKDVSGQSNLGDNITDKSYIYNTIYFNPATTYQAWINADGTRFTGGTDYSNAYAHPSLLQDTVKLGDATQTWFVPKNNSVDVTKPSNYDRYRMSKNKAGVVQLETCLGSSKNNWTSCGSVDAPAGLLTNYATWYSYHRTRIKVAKAGASEAFSQLASNIRVGYDSIWNRSPYQIPVASSGGEFSGSNRSDWFTHLQAADGSGGTPLLGALQRTGEYFSNTTASGPWGPSTGSNQISCRQNFAILTTDGYWNNSSGYTKVGDTDGTAGPTITEINDNHDSYSYSPLKPFTDNFDGKGSSKADTLADVAMHYWKRDLVAGLVNNVPVSDADEASWQHMVTFGISIGLQGRLNPSTDLDDIRRGIKHWGDPTDVEDLDRIDDLWHAAVNGHGNFVAATSPAAFVEGLRNALAVIGERPGSASNVTANSTSFETDSRIYQASYVAGAWNGELAAYDADSAGASDTPRWKASGLIPTSGRKIFTTDGSSGMVFPTATQVAALARPSGLSPVTGADNAAYIAGDRSRENTTGKLRIRRSALGDIADSSPMYVKSLNTIFVGANDGMLHAFDANTGVERFAVVPGGIDLAALASLSDRGYTHKYFVDGPIVVSSTAQTPGRNILVGALGRGGKGVFALDVSNPASFGTGDVLWQRNSDPDMGQVLGEPLVVTLNTLDGGGLPQKAVIVSNGINSSNGDAALFVIDIVSGKVIRKINTGATGDNGLSAPRGVDLNGDGKVDYVYAGDLQGHVWKFDLNNIDSNAWTLANSGNALFTARDSAGKAQPITAGVAVAKQPNTGKLWVFVGTGRFLSTGDVRNTDVQSMYGLIDDGTPIGGRTDLVERQIVVVTTKDGRNVRAFEKTSTLATDKRGWYIDLDEPTPGERIVSNPRVRGTVLLTASMIPPSDDTCNAGGTGYINALDAFTGSSLSAPYFDANNSGDFKDDVLTSGDDTLPIGSIGTKAMPTLPVIIDDRLFWGNSNGSNESAKVNPQGGSIRRVSWREILLD